MPTPPPTHDVTQLLLAWRNGDDGALERLIPVVYRELRRLAHLQMRDERPGHPLNTTDLLHEAYFRLVDADRIPWQNRAHFFAIASRAMRRVLVEQARARRARKRGGSAAPLPFTDRLGPGRQRPPDLVALDDALSELEKLNPRRAKVVEMRYFGGLSVEETADALRVSSDTVTRDWNRARVWLLNELTAT